MSYTGSLVYPILNETVAHTENAMNPKGLGEHGSKSQREAGR